MSVEGFGILGGRSRGGRLLRALGGSPKTRESVRVAAASGTKSAPVPAGSVSQARFDDLHVVSIQRHLYVEALRKQMQAAGMKPVPVPSREEAEEWIASR